MAQKQNRATDLEKAKKEILKKIAEKVKADPRCGGEFAAAHSSHSSGSKHHSNTGH
jgi:ribosomal protein S27AE